MPVYRGPSPHAAWNVTPKAVFIICPLLELKGESFMHRWKVGLVPAEPAYRRRRRRRRALVAERKARRRDRGIAAGLSRTERSTRIASVRLAVGSALIAMLMISLGLWVMIWTAVTLLVSALG